MLTCHNCVSFVTLCQFFVTHFWNRQSRSVKPLLKHISAQNWATSSSFKMNTFAQPTNNQESSQLIPPNHLEMRPMNGQSLNHGPHGPQNGPQVLPNPPHSPINGPNNPNSINLQSHRPSIQMHSMNNQPRASPRTIQ